MIKYLLVTFISIAAACEDRGMQGECKSITDCVTNEWTYGTMESPLCDLPGSDYKEPSTKVCCFPTPEPEPEPEPEPGSLAPSPA